MQELLLFVLAVGIMVIATAKYKIHPFLVLLCVSLLMGWSSGLGGSAVMVLVAGGFGDTLGSIGIVIALGTVIGYILEHSGGAKRLTITLLNWVGVEKSPLAMSTIGSVVSISVFCDSGFILLSSLNRLLSRQTGKSITVLAVALATGLYATHVFIPPTPGPLAAAANIGADLGLVIMFGMVVAIPSVLAGLWWATHYASRFEIFPAEEEEGALDWDESELPGAFLSFLPIVLPILLISLRAVADYPGAPLGTGMVKSMFDLVGHPIVALLAGVGAALLLPRKLDQTVLGDWMREALKSAGGVILITGAGGAFGAVLKGTSIGEVLSAEISAWSLGIFLPFILSAALKTAQGSSTVAMVTASAIVAPMLAPMGIDSPVALALAVLATGAGAMTVSHANDSYFWVVAQFSEMDMSTGLRCHTLGTLVTGLAGMTSVAVLYYLFA